MKINYFVITVCIFCFTSISFSLDDDPIQSLYSNDAAEIIYSLDYIVKNNLTEAIDVIHEVIEYKIPFIQVEMLIALYKLEDPEFKVYFDQFMVRSTNFNLFDDSFDSVEAQAIAYIILYLYDDDELTGLYISYNYFIENYNSDYFVFFIKALEKGLNSPFENFAKLALYDIATNHNKKFFRLEALYILFMKYNSDSINLIENAFKNDPSVDVRLNALEYLIKINTEISREIIFTNIHSEENATIRYRGAKYLFNFIIPIYINKIIFLRDNENDETYISLYNIFLNKFIPPPFDPELRSLTITEIIQEHIEQLIDFDWCHVEYRNSINQFYFQLSNDQKSEALSTVEYILNMIESDYLNNYITNEGYKFLFYEHTYLYERLLSEL